MSEKMLEVEVTCPKPDCGAKKVIEVPKYLFDNKKFGTLKIQVHKGVCCEHEFIAFIDRKGKVRGYESIDLSIDISEYSNRKVGEKIYLKDLLNIYGSNAVATMLHAAILDIPINLIVDDKAPNYKNEINTLLNQYLPANYKSPLIIRTLEKSALKKAKLEDEVVISPNGVVINTPWNHISFDYENDLIQKALDILDDESQAIIIQQDLQYLFEKAEFVNEQVKNRTQTLYEDELQDMLRDKFNEEISDYDIMLLKQIVKYRMKGNVGIIKIRSFDKLKEGLW